MRRAMVVLACLAMAGAACTPSDGGAPISAPSTPNAAAINATDAPLLPTDPEALPPVDLDGFRDLLGQLEGTPVLVNFWASWCGPCTREAPHLRAASETYGERVQFLGIDILDDRESARGFMREYGWRYPSLFDVRGEVRDGLGFVGQPVTVIYDARGEVTFTWNGEISAERLETELRRVT